MTRRPMIKLQAYQMQRLFFDFFAVVPAGFHDDSGIVPDVWRVADFPWDPTPNISRDFLLAWTVPLEALPASVCRNVLEGVASLHALPHAINNLPSSIKRDRSVFFPQLSETLYWVARVFLAILHLLEKGLVGALGCALLRAGLATRFPQLPRSGHGVVTPTDVGFV